MLLRGPQAGAGLAQGTRRGRGCGSPLWSCPMDVGSQLSSEQLWEGLAAICLSSHPVTKPGQSSSPATASAWLRPSSARRGCWALDLQPFPPPLLPPLSGHSQAVSQQTLASRSLVAAYGREEDSV